jgi:hypothetical protein
MGEMSMDLLNNSSVAAFVGAFSAFFLVALTDWRRRHRKKWLIKRRIATLKEIGIAKRETAHIMIKIIQNNRFDVAPVMKFPVDGLKSLQSETLDVLSSTEINAIDGLIYWMESIDGRFERVRSIAEELAIMVKKDTPVDTRLVKKIEMLAEYNDIIKNIRLFENMSTFYLKNEPEKILEFQVENQLGDFQLANDFKPFKEKRRMRP